MIEQIRSFIAIELSEEVKAELSRLQDKLKAGRTSGAKWVDPYGIHLTLKFLGNIVAETVGKVTEAMEEAAKEVSPFSLEVKGLGAFPNLNRVQVVWVGVGGEVDKLVNLQKRIDVNLSPLGFAPESRPFTPHLTLARMRNEASQAERQKLGQLIAKTSFETSYTFEVGSINLMRSQLTPQGAIYSRIGSVALENYLTSAGGSIISLK
ncbi:MAG: RNA 2',3'-cyclic phosphodiesterase [Chloroflexi bacterium]|nr:RNA 2',3'-cyclic phosphodiesterase [Chloroflexota bacterium]